MSTNYNISLTDSALKKIHSLAEQEGGKSCVLRVAVSGGGCSGFRYNFLIDQINRSLFLDDKGDGYEDSEGYGGYSSFSRRSEDIVINDENGNPVLMVDNCSAKFLSNSIIDYTENLSGSGFQVKNALAKSRCGCGNSFSI